jgi:hypothetical protein
VKLAEAHRCPALRVTTPDEADAALERALSYSEGPIFVEFVVAQEDNVYPMIPAGQTVNEILDTPAGPAGGVMTAQYKGTRAFAGKEAHVTAPVR